MKILYSVQATGNGHISRAHELYPYLCEIGEVDIMISGSNATLKADLPVKYRSKGLSLFYSHCGGLDYFKIFKHFSYKRILKEANDLPVENYDLIINDFDHITARACRNKKVASIQFGHQASFYSSQTPRPKKKSNIGEWILNNYAPAQRYVGLHFERYDDFIFPPVIKESFVNAIALDHGHISVYLPSFDKKCLIEIFKQIPETQIHWFVHETERPHKEENITYFPIQRDYFNDSLIHCHGLLTGGGFETPAEALYLRKKLMVIPIEGHYEQQCNAAALLKSGINTLKILNEKTKHHFFNWISQANNGPTIEKNNIKETLEFLLS